MSDAPTPPKVTHTEGGYTWIQQGAFTWVTQEGHTPPGHTSRLPEVRVWVSGGVVYGKAVDEAEYRHFRSTLEGKLAFDREKRLVDRITRRRPAQVTAAESAGIAPQPEPCPGSPPLA